MKKIIIKLLRKIGFKKIEQISQGDSGVKSVGHRNYVGGNWEKIGKLQFDFLVKEGLQPHNILVDIACGSLRAGVHFIPYLDKGNYLGIEKEETLINLGLEHELKSETLENKSPEFVISKEFEVSKFSKIPDYAIAQSLFTHLPPDLINLCFKNLRKNFSPQGLFYATFFVTDNKVDNPNFPHDHNNYKYTISEIKAFGLNNGWDCEFIGEWGHPRFQQIAKYRPQ